MRSQPTTIARITGITLLTAGIGVLPFTAQARANPSASTADSIIWQQLGADIDGEAVDDESGNEVALSADGTTVAIGAPYNDDNGDKSGHTRVYRSNGGTWTQVGADIDGGGSSDFSGTALSLSADGNVLAIGAPRDFSGTNAGYVRVFRLVDDAWTQIGPDIDGEASGDWSGFAVSLSSDGTILAVGGPYNSGSAGSAGHVRVYQLDGDTWRQLGDDIDGEAANDWSGSSVSLSGDGTIVAIGSPRNDGNGSDAGHVRVFRLVDDTWTQVGGDIDGEAEYDWSGNSVSLSSDGTIVAVGGPYNSGSASSAGHVRVYQLDGDTWRQLGDDIDGEAANDESGLSISLSGDGTTLAVGAYLNDGNGDRAGHTRVYQLDNDTWTQIGPDIDGEADGDQSGYSVALSGDGTRLVVGAPTNSDSGNAAGHARVFEAPAPPPTTTTTTTTPPTTAAPTDTVPTPDGAVTDPVAVTPGQTVSVSAPCKTGKKVSIKLGSQSRIADCVATTAATGQPITYDGLATTTLTAPLTPGRYQIEVELIDEGIRYVIPLTVTGGELPATGTGTTSTGIALALALLGAGVLIITTTRRRRHI